MEKVTKEIEDFIITSVSREDLESAGFDASNVDDIVMSTLADKMADDYLEQLFWSSLRIIAENLDIPKKEDGKKPNHHGVIIDGKYVVKGCWDCDTCTSSFGVYYKSDDEVLGDYIGEISTFHANEYNVVVDGEIDEDNMLECIEEVLF